jgi:predicted nucleic acid-binding protein
VIVVDASALLEVLLRVSPAGDIVEDRVFAPDQAVHVPHLIDLEVTQVLRKRALNGLLTIPRCLRALEDLANLQLFRHPHDFLLSRVWELRDNISAYDAVYVALAEFLNAPLLTRDRRLANAPGHYARVDLI